MTRRPKTIASGPIHPGILGVAFLSDADSYIHAAQVLKDDRQAIPPLFFLLGHALELSLKAFLIVKGVEERELREELKHNLRALYRRAGDCGFHVDDERVALCVDALNKWHYKNIFRYRRINKDGSIVAPKALVRPDELLEAIGVVRNYTFKYVLTARLEAASEGGIFSVEYWSMGFSKG